MSFFKGRILYEPFWLENEWRPVMARIIGIRHRVKQTVEGEPRPTMVAIQEEGNVRTFELGDETAELDFVLGRFPTSWRSIGKEEEPSSFLPHHVVWRKLKSGEKLGSFQASHLRLEGKIWYVAERVPQSYEGLRSGDAVSMILGGSGDRLAYALSRRGEEIGAVVYRIPPFRLKEIRGDDIQRDHFTLIEIYERQPNLFYQLTPRDRELIFASEAFRSRKHTQRDRIACSNRLRQRAIGMVFLSPEGKYPEGRIEDLYDSLKANDGIFSALETEEARREAEVRTAVSALDVWQRILQHVDGCGEVIAGGIISAIIDIRRFETDAKLKAFAGVHILEDGRFPRKRRGEVANWNPQLRQSLYQLAKQFLMRPESEWGQRLRRFKLEFRQRHPEVLVVNGKRRYNDAHIQKMAIWRTLTKFVEWLYREWWALERSRS